MILFCFSVLNLGPYLATPGALGPRDWGPAPFFAVFNIFRIFALFRGLPESILTVYIVLVIVFRTNNYLSRTTATTAWGGGQTPSQ